jgi:hypothetical protein
MTKPRWHPLPIDSQVVAAIEDRREKFITSYKTVTSKDDIDPHEKWAFNHICTVLDHAKKIFEMSEEELCNTDKLERKIRDENGAI